MGRHKKKKILSPNELVKDEDFSKASNISRFNYRVTQFIDESQTNYENVAEKLIVGFQYNSYFADEFVFSKNAINFVKEFLKYNY